MVRKFVKHFARYREIIIVKDYTFAGGGARPIFSYYRNERSKGRKDILLIRLIERKAIIRLIVLLLFKNRMVVNGIAPFYSWITYLVLLVKKNAIIYLHEAEPHIAPFILNNYLKGKLFKHVLEKRKVAFVSEWQKEYFERNFKIAKSNILYNAVNTFYLNKSNNVKVCMIAYQTKNKNVDFFSKLADRSKEKSLNFDFYWIGGEGGEIEHLYHSKNVIWLGDQDNVTDILNNMDVLLFTSKSDTFGLAIIEALYKNKYIVSYKENGLSSHIKKLPGCRIFDEFHEDTVLNLINDVIKEKIDTELNKNLIQDLCGLENFSNRLNNFFEENW